MYTQSVSTLSIDLRRCLMATTGVSLRKPQAAGSAGSASGRATPATPSKEPPLERKLMAMDLSDGSGDECDRPLAVRKAKQPPQEGATLALEWGSAELLKHVHARHLAKNQSPELKRSMSSSKAKSATDGTNA